MKRNFIGGGIGLALLALFGSFLVHEHHAYIVARGLDSPVIVAGGSVYGQVDPNSVPWAPIRFESLYSATSTQNDNVVLSGLADSSGHALAPITLQDTGGWLISISTQDSNNNKRSNSISFCSDTSGGHCREGSLGDNFRVYLEANPPNRLEVRSEQRELHFHDTDRKCDGNTNGESKACDVISSVTISTYYPRNGQPITYPCAAVNSCSIAVGKPISLLKFAFH